MKMKPNLIEISKKVIICQFFSSLYKNIPFRSLIYFILFFPNYLFSYKTYPVDIDCSYHL